MTAQWYLVKFVKDMYRNEPANVGVIVQLAEHCHLKVIGERPDGTIDGRSIRQTGAPTDAYRSWVDYLRRALARGDIERLITRLPARLSPFYIERRGSILGEIGFADITQLTEDLFQRCVSHDDAPSAHVDFRTEVDRLISDLSVKVVRDPVFEAKVGRGTQPVHFDYKHEGTATTTLIDRLPLGGKGQRITQGANDFLWRVQLARETGFRNFVALHPPAENNEMEQAILAVESYANAVPIYSPEEARVHLAEILGVGLMRDETSAQKIVQ